MVHTTHVYCYTSTLTKVYWYNADMGNTTQVYWENATLGTPYTKLPMYIGIMYTWYTVHMYIVILLLLPRYIGIMLILVHTTQHYHQGILV